MRLTAVVTSARFRAGAYPPTVRVISPLDSFSQQASTPDRFQLIFCGQGASTWAFEVSMKLTVKALTPDLWPALADLFGRAGASSGCWCMYWRLGPGYHDRPRERNRDEFLAIVQRGPPPGLLAFAGDTAVGWCQLTPRSALPYLDRSRPTRRVDEMPVWALSCFYVRRGYRKRGVTAALIRAALRVARQANAPALEAYPVDTARPGATSNLYTGVASTFARAGFKTVMRRGAHRLIMRHDLSGVRA